MNLFKQHRNKTFSYRPRHQSEQELNKNDNLESEWQDLRKSSKRKKSIFTTLPFMVLFLIAILVLLYILSRYE